MFPQNTYALYWNQKYKSQYLESNYVPADYDYMIWCQQGLEYSLEDYKWVVTPEQVLSGELAYRINHDFGEYTLLWQRLGVDALPINGCVEDYLMYCVETDKNGNFINVCDPNMKETTEEQVDDTTAGDTVASNTTAAITEAATTASPETTKSGETTATPAPIGCGGAIGTATALVLVALLAPAGVLLQKKED